MLWGLTVASNQIVPCRLQNGVRLRLRLASETWGASPWGRGGGGRFHLPGHHPPFHPASPCCHPHPPSPATPPPCRPPSQTQLWDSQWRAESRAQQLCSSIWPWGLSLWAHSLKFNNVLWAFYEKRASTYLTALQVFDSGSSCSNEECWEGDGKVD